MNDSVASECRKHVFGAQFTNTSFLNFYNQTQSYENNKMLQISFLGGKLTIIAQKNIQPSLLKTENNNTYNITNCLYIVILVIFLLSGFCLFSPVSGSQYPNFFDPNLFLGQRKATTKKNQLNESSQFREIQSKTTLKILGLIVICSYLISGGFQYTKPTLQKWLLLKNRTAALDETLVFTIIMTVANF